MSAQSRGLGSGRGRVKEYQIPLPENPADIVNVLALELATAGVHSIHVEEGRPIVVTRYVDLDDMLATDELSTPQELLRQVANMITVSNLKKNPRDAFFSMLAQMHSLRLVCSAVIVGSKDHFFKWLNADVPFVMASQPKDRSHDFNVMDMKGYVDTTLDPDKIAILGGTSTTPTRASVEVAITGEMYIGEEDGRDIRASKESDGGSGADGAGGGSPMPGVRG